jgi:hypothetical protein
MATEVHVNDLVRALQSAGYQIQQHQRTNNKFSIRGPGSVLVWAHMPHPGNNYARYQVLDILDQLGMTWDDFEQHLR